MAPDAAGRARQGAGRSACFLSLDVDSTYTLLKHARALDHVIIHRSFDCWPWDDAYCAQVLAAAEELLSNFDPRPSVILLDSNQRAFSERWLDWRLYMHGAALAGAAHALSAGLSKCLVAAGYTYRDLVPSGVSPLLDPLWSSHALEIVHDGAEASKLSKIRRIAQSPFAVRNLRVCHAPVPGRFNCGRCNKCLRITMQLYLTGVLEHCRTLPGKLDLEAVKKIRIDSAADRIHLEEVREHLRRPGADAALREALEHALSGTAPKFSARAITLLLQAARDKVNAGDYAGATAYLEEVLELSPNNPEAPYLLGFCFLQQRRKLDRALLLLNTALAYGFTEFWVRYARASLYQLLGRIPEALADARRAAELDPAHPGARQLLGWLESLPS